MPSLMGINEEMDRSFQSLRALIQHRRTVKDFSGEKISQQDLEDILQLAPWAPNHHLNEPWTFRVLNQNAIKLWISFLENHLSTEDLNPLQKAIHKIKLAGAVIHVTSKIETSALVDLENYAATSAAVQNILLAASAKHIQSFWSTSAISSHPKTWEYLKIGADERLVACIWLGYGPQPEPKLRKKTEDRIKWIQ